MVRRQTEAITVPLTSRSTSAHRNNDIKIAVFLKKVGKMGQIWVIRADQVILVFV